MTLPPRTRPRATGARRSPDLPAVPAEGREEAATPAPRRRARRPPATPPEAPSFAAAAAALAARTDPALMPAPVRTLVEALGLRPDDAPLLRLAARIGRPFRLPAPDAPGLVVFGASVDLCAAAGEAPGAMPAASASGVGETPGAALRACLGEAAELLASTETAAHRAAMRPVPPAGEADPGLDALLAALPWPGGKQETVWHPARRMTDDAPVWLPRELAFRTPPARRAFPPPWPLSLGCAAGRTVAEAALHGLLELVERDAVALWWRGGLPPRPIALEDPAAGDSAALLARLRRDRAPLRRSWLLDITSDLGIATVAAVSVGADGQGFCCGFAARAGGLAAAARAAVLELAQMELGQALALRHAALRGADALNPADAAHLRRRSGIDPAHCALVHPAGAPAVITPLVPDGTPAEVALAALLDRLALHGLAPIRLDHAATDAVCLPVLRVLCPGLESETSPLVGPRLRDAVARTGGGATHRAGITLT